MTQNIIGNWWWKQFFHTIRVNASKLCYLEGVTSCWGTGLDPHSQRQCTCITAKCRLFLRIHRLPLLLQAKSREAATTPHCTFLWPTGVKIISDLDTLTLTSTHKTTRQREPGNNSAFQNIYSPPDLLFTLRYETLRTISGLHLVFCILLFDYKVKPNR